MERSKGAFTQSEKIRNVRQIPDCRKSIGRVMPSLGYPVRVLFGNPSLNKTIQNGPQQSGSDQMLGFTFRVGQGQPK